ncbi:hypothetical protein CCHR01_01011 [Colletotrichum chrysophilum]|uniref:Uncharacterized protein n=1 Tax=Colletotrichum chrysophilum TaxID=1836956 RepID=A0AAD9EPP0_9PEZI|nr:hypothetical protein CCHR01_01011 [Colletotrichum chrysophilum]
MLRVQHGHWINFSPAVSHGELAVNIGRPIHSPARLCVSPDIDAVAGPADPDRTRPQTPKRMPRAIMLVLDALKPLCVAFDRPQARPPTRRCGALWCPNLLISKCDSLSHFVIPVSSTHTPLLCSCLPSPSYELPLLLALVADLQLTPPSHWWPSALLPYVAHIYGPVVPKIAPMPRQGLLRGMALPSHMYALYLYNLFGALPNSP